MPHKDPEVRRAYQAARREKKGEELRAKARADYYKNKDAYKARSLRRRLEKPEAIRAQAFGMVFHHPISTLRERQDGKCPVCRRQLPEGREMAVDHDHKTGLVRGLLCKKCNMGLGLLNDAASQLLRAVHYLQGSPE